jgi:ABC-type nitrate/sulfonate/bicarbonate transport system, permease component
MEIEKKGLSAKSAKWLWLLLSIVTAIALWTLLSVLPSTSRSFPNIFKTFSQIKVMIARHVLWTDISSSLISVIAGYFLGFVIALPVAILMAWYKPVRYIIEPWINFIRNIPPLAYVPLVVIAAGVGRKPQIIVITLATFLTMCITMYQGIVNIDETLDQGRPRSGCLRQGHLPEGPCPGIPAVHHDRSETRFICSAHDPHRR